jgi:hypothetical protein
MKKANEVEQPAFFEMKEWWEDHWQGMPEFVQKDLMPAKTIYVHFESKEDMAAFAKLVGQTIGPNTKSIWYPEKDIQHWDKRWVDSLPAPETEESDSDCEEIFQ